MAPTALNVAEPPIHIIVGLLVAVKVGFGFTVNVIVFVFVHPKPLAPVTV